VKLNFAQSDNLARNLVDTIKTKLLDDAIPRKSVKDKLMYPHRWYVKQLLRPRISNLDTNYITSTKREFTFVLPISKKFYGFNINDLSDNRRLKFSPNTYYHIGFNFSNIILTFGFGSALRFGAKPNHGKTISRDLQLTVIGKRIITDVNYQNYKSFYVSNSNEFFPSRKDDTVIIRPDIHVISFGVNTMYIYNYKKYSLRGAFSFTDTQRKSASSFMTGIYHSHVVFSSTDSSFFKYPLIDYFSDELTAINRLSIITIGINAGYGYTYVHKKIIFSNAVNVGLGGQKINYKYIDNSAHSQPLNLSASVNAKAALRYDNLKFFVGVLAAYDNNFTFKSKSFNTETYISKIVFFVGYRFQSKYHGRKILKNLGLIDYNKK
jgi:hypothetical protein